MKPILKVLAAFAVVITTFIFSDIVFGKVADYVTQNKGRTKQNYFMSGRDHYDIIFIGSSRAYRHYDAPFINDSLGFKAFNAGEDGRGLSYQYPELKAYLSHNNPRLIVLELSPSIDGKWNERIAMLYPLADKYSDIVSTAEKIDPANKYYLKSGLYRYNSNMINELRGLRNPFVTKSFGFDPVPVRKAPQGTFDADRTRTYLRPIDTVECSILEDLIHLCNDKNVRLVGVISPIYGKIDRRLDVDSIFKANNIPFIDNTSFRLPLDPEEYFKDETHLNIRGAREYTKYVMHQISDSLNLIK